MLPPENLSTAVVTADSVENRSFSDNHIILLNSGTNAFPLFLIPGAGGLSDSYFPLAKALGDIPVIGLHMMGTQAGDIPFKTIRQIARANVKWIRQVQPHGPYRIVGHSFGGHVAYETALQLERNGESVSLVAILDVWSGLNGIRLTDENKVGFILGMAADYYLDFNIISPPYPEWIHELQAQIAAMKVEEIVPYIGQFLKGHISHMDDNIDLVTRLVNLRIYNAQMDFRPEQRLQAELVVFKTESTEEDNDAAMGWGPFCTHIDTIALPGNHDMLHPENIVVISQDISRRYHHTSPNL